MQKIASGTSFSHIPRSSIANPTKLQRLGMSVRAKTLLQMINVFHRLITSLDGIVEPYCLSVFVTKQQRIYFDHWSRRIAHVSIII